MTMAFPKYLDSVVMLHSNRAVPEESTDSFLAMQDKRLTVCQHQFDFNNMVFHIFGDKFGGDDASIRSELLNFMADNVHDVKRRCKDVFEKRGINVSQYFDMLETDAVRADEIAIFFLAMQHSVHVKVILKRGFWATGHDCGEEDYALVFVYQGDNIFRLTVEGAGQHDDLRPVRSPKPYVRCKSPFAALLGTDYRQRKDQHVNKKRDAVTLQENERGKLESKSYVIQKKKSVGVVQRWCHLCRDRFVSLRLLNRHMIEVHEQMYQCDVCGQTLYSRETLRRHKATFHATDRPFKCTQCDKSFLFQSHLDSHRRSHSSVKQHTCPAGQCGKSFKFKGDLTSHFAAKHENPDKKFQCEKCPLTFQTKKLLKLHHFIHGPPTRKCPYCDEYFHWHSQVRNHVRYNHITK